MRDSIAQARAYLAYVLKHKKYVYQEGRKLGLSHWACLIHDWHKLLPDEFIPYMRMFYGYGGESFYKLPKTDPLRQKIEAAFDVAWLKHQRRSGHHWQAWVLHEDSGKVKTLKMPRRYALEMLADWRGAGRAITGKDDTASWYLKTLEGRLLHPETKRWVEANLGLFG